MNQLAHQPTSIIISLYLLAGIIAAGLILLIIRYWFVIRMFSNYYLSTLAKAFPRILVALGILIAATWITLTVLSWI